MPQNSPDVVRCAVEGTYQGQGFVNVLHFQKRDASAVTPSDLAALAGILDDARTDPDSLGHIYQEMDTGLAVSRFRLVTLGSGGNPSYGLDRSVSFAGLSAGTDAMAMLACILKWNTGFATPRGRGRMFLTGVNTGMFGTDPDYISTSFQTVLGTAASDWVTAWLANTTWAFVINSFIENHPTSTTMVEEVLTSSVNPLFGVQRRRRPRATA